MRRGPCSGWISVLIERDTGHSMSLSLSLSLFSLSALPSPPGWSLYAIERRHLPIGQEESLPQAHLDLDVELLEF